MPVPAKRSTASLTLKSCSSSASSRMSSLVLGNIFEIAERASRLVYDVGVAGQSETGALDQLVTAVSGLMFNPDASVGRVAVGAGAVTGAWWITPASGVVCAMGAA